MTTTRACMTRAACAVEHRDYPGRVIHIRPETRSKAPPGFAILITEPRSPGAVHCPYSKGVSVPKQRYAAASRRRSGRRTQPSRSTTATLQPYLLVGGAAVLAIFAFLFVRAGGSETLADPAQVQLASANAGGAEVKVLTGSRHTVYHMVAPLPSAASPRADGRPTLVWFSGTWCAFCERMEPFAHRAAGSMADRVVFVEKSVDDDRDAASRYGIRGTPTFVLVDAAGKEVTRFGFQRDEQSFVGAIESALARLA